MLRSPRFGKFGKLFSFSEPAAHLRFLLPTIALTISAPVLGRKSVRVAGAWSENLPLLFFLLRSIRFAELMEDNAKEAGKQIPVYLRAYVEVD